MSAIAAIPAAALEDHLAIIGKTGSGKTSTEKLAIEQVVAEGFRVCVLDSVKSDWWGITSSASGKRPGLPFKILGGPRGHLPLHSSAGAVIGKLVGSGELPLSIIDMADFEAGGLQRFFVDFAPALMKSMKGVVYLVIEEAHEFAPKERAGIGAETLAIHWAKKLATAGRSKGIRLIVATQRVQALHNAVLGSCETLITHRLTAPADQDPVVKWLRANADKATATEVEASLSGLATGTGWLCSGKAQIFQKVAFPKFRTYDNTSTPMGDGEEVAIKTAPVDQEALRAILGAAVKEAEANDPKALKAEVARLQRELNAVQVAPTIAPEALAERYHQGFGDGLARGREEAADAWRQAAASASELVDQALSGLLGDLRSQAFPTPPPFPPSPAAPGPRPASPAAAPPHESAAAQPVGSTAVTGAQRKLITALAWWRALDRPQPTGHQVAFIAGYSPTSSTFTNIRGSLKTAGLVDYPSPGRIALTPEGAALAPRLEKVGGRDVFHDAVRAKLSGPQVKLLDPLLAAYPGHLTSAALAEASGYSATSSTFTNIRGSLATLDVVTYPAPGQVRAADWLFS